jgi:PAS domain S-box-containing protein
MDNIMDTAFSKLRKEAEEFLQSKSAIAGSDGSESLHLIKALLANQSILDNQNEELRISKATVLQEYEIYQDIINSQPVGVYRIHVFSQKEWGENAWHSSDNPPYKMELASDRFCEILGVTRQEFDVNPYLIVDLICADDKSDFVQKNEEANRNLTPFNWQGRLSVQQELKWVRLESRPRVLTSGDIIWTGLLYDITERKLTEEALIATRFKLDSIVEALHVGIVDINVETGELAFNQVYPQMVGYTYDELTKSLKESVTPGWRGIVHPYDIEITYDAYTRYLESKLPYYEYECRVKHKDGHWVWMHQRASITSRTPDGRPLIMSGIHTDISHRKRLEQELNQLNEELEERIAERTRELEELNSSLQLTEEKFRTIADFTYDWEYWKSPENEIIYMSPSVEKMTGYTAQEFVDNPELLDNIIYRSDSAGWQNHKKNRHNHTSNENSTELNFRIKRKDGQIRWIGHVCRDIIVNGKSLGLRVSNRDITEKVEAENKLLQVTIEVEERERNRFSSELHDGMGPLLSIIKLYFQWLSETDDVEKIKIITLKGNESIESAIQSTRELARGLSSRLLMKTGFVNALIHFTERINETQKIKISFTYNSTNRFSRFTEMALYRITTELIKNTLTYARATNIEIQFDFDKAKNIITFVYTDNGIGFDWHEVAQKGDGLGLMNIQNRVQQMRGELNIDSSPKNGMKAFFKLPLDEYSDLNLFKE